ncbi:MAG: hypothetical protein WBG08_08250 [Litorimonas sp.]
MRFFRISRIAYSADYVACIYAVTGPHGKGPASKMDQADKRAVTGKRDGVRTVGRSVAVTSQIVRLAVNGRQDPARTGCVNDRIIDGIQFWIRRLGFPRFVASCPKADAIHADEVDGMYFNACSRTGIQEKMSVQQKRIAAGYSAVPRAFGHG